MPTPEKKYSSLFILKVHSTSASLYFSFLLFLLPLKSLLISQRKKQRRKIFCCTRLKNWPCSEQFCPAKRENCISRLSSIPQVKNVQQLMNVNMTRAQCSTDIKSRETRRSEREREREMWIH